MSENNPVEDEVVETLLEIVNTVRENKGQARLRSLAAETRLRDDLGFDSMDLAELTVRIDHRFHIDVFATGVVDSVSEVVQRIIDKRIMPSS